MNYDADHYYHYIYLSYCYGCNIAADRVVHGYIDMVDIAYRA